MKTVEIIEVSHECEPEALHETFHVLTYTSVSGW